MTRPPPPSTLFPYTTLFRSTGFTAKTQRREESRKEAKMEIKTTKSSKEPSDSAPEKGHSLRRKTVQRADRKSTRLNSSHVRISYAVFCLKKKKKDTTQHVTS